MKVGNLCECSLTSLAQNRPGVHQQFFLGATAREGNDVYDRFWLLRVASSRVVRIERFIQAVLLSILQKVKFFLWSNIHCCSGIKKIIEKTCANIFIFYIFFCNQIFCCLFCKIVY